MLDHWQKLTAGCLPGTSTADINDGVDWRPGANYDSFQSGTLDGVVEVDPGLGQMETQSAAGGGTSMCVPLTKSRDTSIFTSSGIY